MKINKNIINAIIIAVIFIALIVYMLVVDGIDNIISVFGKINQLWMLAALLLIIGYWVCESIVLYIITRKVHNTEKFGNSFRVTMIGQLFNNLTPFSSGGQPMQAVAMVKSGVSGTSAATILLIKFIVYQLALVIYTSIVMLFKYAYFKDTISGFVSLSMVGFIINFVVIVSLVIVGVNKNVVFAILKPIYLFLGKIKVLKNADEKLLKLRSSMDVFHEKFKIIRKEKMMLFKTFLISILQLTVFFSITYAVYRGFGHHTSAFFDIISAQSFLMMIMAFIPTPGAGGAAEGGFFVIFKTFFAANEINMAILFWRVFTFYLPIIVGAMFLVVRGKKNKENKQSDMLESELKAME